MKTPDDNEPPEMCAPGEHNFREHEHGHVPAEYRSRRCSGRHWCQACRRWFDGELCHGGKRPHGAIPDPVA